MPSVWCDLCAVVTVLTPVNNSVMTEDLSAARAAHSWTRHPPQWKPVYYQSHSEQPRHCNRALREFRVKECTLHHKACVTKAEGQEML